MFKLTGKYADSIIFQDFNKVESGCIAQIQNLIDSPAYENCKIRIMPDCHAGVSAPIGTTIKIKDKVIPNTVSVDIGCGMYLVKLEGIEEKNINFEKFDNYIKTHIPSGRNIREGRIVKFPSILSLKCYRELKDTDKFEKALGTLGGG